MSPPPFVLSFLLCSPSPVLKASNQLPKQPGELCKERRRNFHQSREEPRATILMTGRGGKEGPADGQKGKEETGRIFATLLAARREMKCTGQKISWQKKVAANASLLLAITVFLAQFFPSPLLPNFLHPAKTNVQQERTTPSIPT